MMPTPPPNPMIELFRGARRVGLLERLLPASWRLKRFAKQEAEAKANLIKAIREYWNVNQDPRAAGRQDRRRFARQLADLILEHIGR